MTVVYNPFDPSFVANPYPTFKEMREAEPAYQVPVVGVWLLTRYRDIDEVLHDRDRFTVERPESLEDNPHTRVGIQSPLSDRCANADRASRGTRMTRERTV